MKQVVEVLVLVIYAGIIYSLVRPHSQGPQLVTNIGAGLSNILHTAMGGTPTPINTKGNKS